MLEEWQDCPPSHVSIALFMGIKPKDRTKPEANVVESLDLESE